MDRGRRRDRLAFAQTSPGLAFARTRDKGRIINNFEYALDKATTASYKLVWLSDQLTSADSRQIRLRGYPQRQGLRGSRQANRTPDTKETEAG